MKLPETGFLRLNQIIGQDEITPEQAAENAAYNAQREEEDKAAGRVDRNGDGTFARRPTRPRRGITPIIPASHTAWYDGVAKGHYPPSVKIAGTAFWRVEDIRAVVEGRWQKNDPAAQLVSAAEALKAASRQLAKMEQPDPGVKQAFDAALAAVRGISKPRWWSPSKVGGVV